MLTYSWSVGRLFGKFFGNALLMVGFFLIGGAVLFYARAKFQPKPTTSLTSQIQFDLDDTVQMKNVVTVLPRGPEDDAIIDVRVDYSASPPDVQRGLLIKDTNIVVRRHVPNIGQVQIFFADPKPQFYPDGGAPTPVVVKGPTGPSVIADPGQVPGAGPAAPSGPTVGNGPKPTVTVGLEKPKGSGLVTIVTFPESYVEEGGKQIGKTPLFKVKLPAGTHMLTLTGVDGVAHRLSVPVVANQTKVFKMKLDELPTK